MLELIHVLHTNTLQTKKLNQERSIRSILRKNLP